MFSISEFTALLSSIHHSATTKIKSIASDTFNIRNETTETFKKDGSHTVSKVTEVHITHYKSFEKHSSLTEFSIKGEDIGDMVSNVLGEITSSDLSNE